MRVTKGMWEEKLEESIDYKGIDLSYKIADCVYYGEIQFIRAITP